MPPTVLNPTLLAALERHYDDLVDYIRRRFGDRSHAREVVHDVCIELLENPPREEIRTPLAFLRRVSHNRAIDRHRADSTRLALIEPVAELPDIHTHSQDGAAALDFQQQVEALARIIEALPPRARQVFLLHRIHDMPQAEIAAELGISRNMVTQHFARAMDSILRHWEPAREACRRGRRLT